MFYLICSSTTWFSGPTTASISGVSTTGVSTARLHTRPTVAHSTSNRLFRTFPDKLRTGSSTATWDVWTRVWRSSSSGWWQHFYVFRKVSQKGIYKVSKNMKWFKSDSVKIFEMQLLSLSSAKSNWNLIKQWYDLQILRQAGLSVWLLLFLLTCLMLQSMWETFNHHPKHLILPLLSFLREWGINSE